MQRADRLGTRNLFPDGATAEATVAVAIGAGMAGFVSWKALDASPAATVLATICGAVLGAGLYAASMARRAAVRRVEPELEEPGAIPASSGPQPQPLRTTEIVGYLRKHLGPEVTAFLSGLDDTSAVERWASGEVEPGPLEQERLRFGYEVVRPIVRAYDGETAGVWLFGMNEWLEDESPVMVLRTGRTREEWTPVVQAAEGFVESVP
ncbi:MAG TPA: hypothetical protein VF414_04680 [Thermoanaerobaculia bacterium]